MFGSKELRIMTWCAVAIFLFSSVFDFTVTYTVFKYDRGNFVKHETNQEIKDYLVLGEFPFYGLFVRVSWVFAILVSHIMMLKLRFDMSKRGKECFEACKLIYLMSLFVMLVISGQYYSGGMSWLR